MKKYLKKVKNLLTEKQWAELGKLGALAILPLAPITIPVYIVKKIIKRAKK